MRNIDDGNAILLELANTFEQPNDFVFRKRRRRLIHYKNSRVLRQRFCDLDHLLLCDAEIVRQRMRIDWSSQQFEQARRFGVHSPAIAQFTPKEDVLRNIEKRDQGKFLKDHRDSEPPCISDGMNAHRLSVDQEFTAIRMVRTTEHLDQRRFAGAVLSHKHVHFAGVYSQRNVIERTNTGERLRNSAHLDQRRLVHFHERAIVSNESKHAGSARSNR